MLITTTFGSSKAVLPLGRSPASSKEDCSKNEQRPSSLEESTSTSAVRHRHEGRSSTIHTDKLASSSTTPLTTAETTTLNLYLRSSRSVAQLQIADIQGTIDPLTGEHTAPAVRRGRIRTTSSSTSTTRHDSNTSSGVQCCLIDALPFEKCEIVATVVKKNAIYRRATNDGYDYKGKGRATEDDGPMLPEEVQLIFYELDDDSGASITCCVNPSKVYAKELAESRRRQDAPRLYRSDPRSENDSTTDAESIEETSNETGQSTPRAQRTGRSIRSDEDDNDMTPRKAQPKSDPRLWIYRYKSPPRPLPAARPATSFSIPSFTVPLYKEGTILRITGKIFINASRGNERQLEASSVECVYEPGYVLGKRIYREKGNKYAEWHHTVKCRKKRIEYTDREKVRELIGLVEARSGVSLDASRSGMSNVTSADVAMQDDTTMPSFNDTLNTTTLSTSHISSTSLLDASRLPDLSYASSINTSSTTKAKKAKLPSCSTLYKQKIPITKEIFSLYMHQFFRDLEKGKNGKSGRILAGSCTVLDGGASAVDSHNDGGRVTMEELKNDKNLKWLAEIYARYEAKRLAMNTEDLSSGDLKSGSTTPKHKSTKHVSNAESSIIVPSSSPAHARPVRSTPHHNHTGALMVDTTNISSASLSATSKKIRITPGAVEKIRNDLFRNTILKLVKDGIIIVFPADLSIPTSYQAVSTENTKRNCVGCARRTKLELERVPPVMTVDGTPLRELKAKQMEEEECKCPQILGGSATGQQNHAMNQKTRGEETYGLLTCAMLLPVVESIVQRIDHTRGVELDYVWNAVRRQDDMWRFVSRQMVQECLEMV